MNSMEEMLMASGKKEVSPVSGYTYANAISTGYNSSYTFTDVPIGQAAADRKLLILVNVARGSIDSNTRYPTACVVNGVSIPASSMTHVGSSNVSIGVRVYEAIVASADLADIQITTNRGCDPFAIAVVALYGTWTFADGQSLKQDGSSDPSESVTSSSEAVLIAGGLWENTGGELIGVPTEHDSIADSRQFLFGLEFIASGVSRTLTYEKNSTSWRQSGTALGMWEKN